MLKFTQIAITIFAFICGLGTLQSQSLEISGVIKDGQTGETIPGASVALKGTLLGTFSEFDGTYVLKVNSLSDTLEVSFIGYKKSDCSY